MGKKRKGGTEAKQAADKKAKRTALGSLGGANAGKTAATVGGRATRRSRRR